MQTEIVNIDGWHTYVILVFFWLGHCYAHYRSVVGLHRHIDRLQAALIEIAATKPTPINAPTAPHEPNYNTMRF